MMQAILIGQSFQLQKVWTEQYRSTGTFHAIVISGTHVAILAAFFLFLLRICFVPESVALFVTVLAAWLYALVTGWQAPCVRSAAGLTLFMIAGYFFRERRIMNLLAAVALGFLRARPRPVVRRQFPAHLSGRGISRSLRGARHRRYFGTADRRASATLPMRGRDLHVQARAAQFRIEMRLLAETLRAPLWMVAWPARAGALRLRDRAHVGRGAARPRAAHGGLLSPPRFLRTLGQRLRRAPDGRRGAGRLPRRLHRMALDRQDRRAALCGSRRKWSGSTPTWNRTGGFPRRPYGSASRLRRR